MKAIRRKSDNVVAYLVPDSETVVIDNRGLHTKSVRAFDIKPDTHEVVEGVPAPDLFVGGAMAWNGGWSVVNQEAVAPVVAEMTDRAREEAKAALVAWVNNFLRPFTEGYPETEVLTWPMQSNYARAVSEGDAAQHQTDFIAGMAAKRGITTAEMAALIIAKAGPYEQAVQETASLRSATFKLIEDADPAAIPGILEQAQVVAIAKAKEIGLIA